MVTEAEAQRILAEAKVIVGDLGWRAVAGSYRLEAVVVSEDTEEALSLRGYVGTQNRSFALLFRDTPIRKFTVHPWHIDPVARQRVTDPHKHTWDDIYQDRRVYLPTDIRIGDPNDEILDFLRECNISLIGRYLQQQFRAVR
jgi:hypothetical protein